MSERVYSLEELIELIPEMAEANDVAFYPADQEPSMRVVHVNDNVEGAVYIGRANGRRRLKASPFANPFKITEPDELGPGITRHMACLMYYDYLRSSIDGAKVLALLPELRGKPLACWCRHDGDTWTPKNECHGDQIIRLLTEHTDDELWAMGKS